jgi:hypothetical protein
MRARRAVDMIERCARELRRPANRLDFPVRRPAGRPRMKRKASARWQGTAKEGSGTLSVASGTLQDTPYSFVARFGDGKGTNP